MCKSQPIILPVNNTKLLGGLYMNKPFFFFLNNITKDFPVIFHYDHVSKYEKSEFFHWHPNTEILYVTDGEGRCIIGTEEYEMNKGDLIIINSNLIHLVKSDSEINYYCLIIDSDFCEQNNIPTEQLEYIAHVSDHKAVSLFENIVKAFGSDLDFKETGIKIAVLQLLLFLSRNYIDNEKTLTSKISSSDENIKLAIGYIKSHYNQKLTLEEIANEAGLSKYYFLREFKSVTKMTPFNYINSVRCEYAKKLLLKKVYTIHETAVKCGFENDSYFSKTFRKYTGCLPSEFKI